MQEIEFFCQDGNGVNHILKAYPIMAAQHYGDSIAIPDSCASSAGGRIYALVAMRYHTTVTQPNGYQRSAKPTCANGIFINAPQNGTFPVTVVLNPLNSLNQNLDSNAFVWGHPACPTGTV